MYQEFFGFNRRPFPTHGAPSPLIATAATDEALPPLERCAREGRGIAILSAPAGTGKTAVALELGRRLSNTLHVVYLSSSNYTSRRGLLQAILFELGVPYTGLSEQEARLQVIEFSQSLLPDREGIVLLVDEADQLSERLLEELRALANYMHEGRPLLRLVLCGQLALDERLAAPEMDAFNQRVGCQVVLESLDRKQSADYIRATLTACGAEVAEVFSEEALHLICAASDGNVRCLHHLCDHALLLAFVAEVKPVPALTVRAALEDLQGLPLAWQVPGGAESGSNAEGAEESIHQPAPGIDSDDHTEPFPLEESDTGDHPAAPAGTVEEEAVTTVIEFGGDAPQESPDSPQAVSEQTRNGLPADATMDATAVPADREYRLEDKYAELDRLAELERRNSARVEPDSPGEPMPGLPLPDPAPARTVEAELLAEIADMRAEVRHLTSCDAGNGPSAADHPRDFPHVEAGDETEWDVIQPEPDAVLDNEVTVFEPERHDRQADEVASVDEASGATVPDAPVPEPPIDPTPEMEVAGRREPRNRFDSDDGSRRYAFLFTRLRNRRRDLAARSGRDQS